MPFSFNLVLRWFLQIMLAIIKSYGNFLWTLFLVVKNVLQTLLLLFKSFLQTLLLFSQAIVTDNANIRIPLARFRARICTSRGINGTVHNKSTWAPEDPEPDEPFKVGDGVSDSEDFSVFLWFFNFLAATKNVVESPIRQII